LRITRDPQLADEAVNDTLMIVWQQAASFRHESRLSTWVMGIAYRRETLGGEALAADVAATAERGDWLDRALATLSVEHRLVIELAYYVGLSCEEIAAVADCPVGTVKTRLHYARRHLHGTLEDLQGAPVRFGDLE
jgi:RNA polymerase sigma-70 factor (ECF subfamily)